ncbi:MAG: hypothetical protein LUE11_04050 [Clostridia bacterium]|nr:hypothetical protein [Clostridia bacterium]
MKKKLLALLLAASMALGLTGCGEEIVQNAAEKLLKKDPDASFTLGETYSDNKSSITVELVSLSYDGAVAPMTLAEDSSVVSYTSDDDEDHLYLDCIATIENTGDDDLNLQEDLLFYCIEDDDIYGDCIMLTETEDGTDMETAGTLASGKSARLHYCLIFPEDISWSGLDVRFMMPESSEIYSAALGDLLPKADSLTEGTPVTNTDGISLTLKSAKITDSVKAVSEAGGGYSLSPQTTDNKMLDAVIEVSNNSTQDVPVGTLFSGLALENQFSYLGTVVLEANNDLVYSGTIKAGSTVTTHLTFEVSETPTEANHFYLYFDGTYHSITFSE